MKISQIQAGALVVALASSAALSARGHEATAFGEPGDPKKPSRTVHVVMREDGRKMLYIPNVVAVKKGEQIRFILDNEGELNHEFVLGTEREINAHAAEMKKNPDMEHDDPHSLRLGMLARGEIFWRFTKAGRFVYACLIPGHLERGMSGIIVVK